MYKTFFNIRQIDEYYFLTFFLWGDFWQATGGNGASLPVERLLNARLNRK
jgi:hypothetical protein